MIGAILASCSSYRQNIMFKGSANGAVQDAARQAEKNYVIQKNDYLTLEVYSHKGERIIDPDFKLAETSAPQGGAAKEEVKYLVDAQGRLNLPMLGMIKAEGLSISEFEAILQKEYSNYYDSTFVLVRFQNKRVIVLGAPGGQVIPLENESTSLVEILALAHGVDNNAKAHNIRVLRNDQAYVIDFSTIDGFRKGNMIMQSGDVIYVEPIRRPVIEFMRDYSPFITIATTITTLIFVATN